MDFVTGLPVVGHMNHNAVLVLVCRKTKKCKFLPTHQEATALDTALLYYKHIFPEYGLAKVIISDRDPKFTSEFWTSLHMILGSKLSFSTAYHPQTNQLAERMIQTLEDMIRRYCSYGCTYTDNEGYTHDWETLLPALEMAYNSSAHSTTGKTPFELDKGFNPRVPTTFLKEKMVHLHPNAVDFHEMLIKARNHAARCVEEAVDYNKSRWDKTHKEPDFKVGDLVLVSTTNFNNIAGPKKLKDSFAGPFVIKAMHGKNAVEVILTGDLDRKHPTFPVSLIKPYLKSDRDKFPIRNKMKVKVPPLENIDLGSVSKILDQKITRKEGKDFRYFLCRFKHGNSDDDKWLEEKDIPDAKKLLRDFRHQKRS